MSDHLAKAKDYINKAEDCERKAVVEVLTDPDARRSLIAELSPAELEAVRYDSVEEVVARSRAYYKSRRG